MAEADLVRRWLTKLRKDYHAWAERHSAYELTSGRGQERLGMPDFEVCLDGHYLGIEAKKNVQEWRDWVNNKSDQSLTQKKCIAEIRAAGGISFCTWRWSDIEEAITMLQVGLYTNDSINNHIDEVQQHFLEKTNARRLPCKTKRSGR